MTYRGPWISMRISLRSLFSCGNVKDDVCLDKQPLVWKSLWVIQIFRTISKDLLEWSNGITGAIERERKRKREREREREREQWIAWNKLI